MTDPNTNPYAGSGQSPWQPGQTSVSPTSSTESGTDDNAANPAGGTNAQPNSTYLGGGSVPPQTPYNPYAQGGASYGQGQPVGQGQPYGRPYAQSYNQPYAQPYGYMPPEANQQYNGFAIAGFVCSFFTSIVGLIFSIIGLTQIKRRGGKGKDLSIAGIIISVAKLGIYLLLMVMLIIGAFSGLGDAVMNDLQLDYSYSQYDDGLHDYDDQHDLDLDDLNRALDELNGMSGDTAAFTSLQTVNE